MIIDFSLIKYSETSLDTINAVSHSFSGFELYGFPPKRIEELKNLFKNLEKKPDFAFVDSNKKLKLMKYYQKKTYLASNEIFGLLRRVALDCHIFGDLEKFVNYVEEFKNDKIYLNKKEEYEMDLNNAL